MVHYLSIPYAQAAIDATAFGRVVNPIIANIVYPIIELMFGVVLVVFVWGIIQMIIHGNDETARLKGKMTMFYGTIGIFIMLSAWGIIYLVSNTVKGL